MQFWLLQPIPTRNSRAVSIQICVWISFSAGGLQCLFSSSSFPNMNVTWSLPEGTLLFHSCEKGLCNLFCSCGSSIYTTRWHGKPLPHYVSTILIGLQIPDKRSRHSEKLQTSSNKICTSQVESLKKASGNGWKEATPLEIR